MKLFDLLKTSPMVIKRESWGDHELDLVQQVSVGTNLIYGDYVIPIEPDRRDGDVLSVWEVFFADDWIQIK